jgi:site-specific recombinase XerD
LIEFLRQENIIPPAKVGSERLSPMDRCVQGFERYLREDRALAESTIIHYGPFVRDLLKRRFGEGPVKLLRLTAADIVTFVQEQAQRLPIKQAKLMTTALRSFLRYARYRGELKLDLTAAVPIVANWSRASIPRAIPPDQVRQLLSSINRQTAMGRRDYAIFLLLARLGLRAGQVASLELDDIDWSTGQLRVRGKGGRPSELPLPAEVGKAIAVYLRCGRRPSVSRRVFLRVRAPYRGFQGSSSVSTLVGHALKRAGIDAPTRGAHQFRHGLASEMLRHDASLAEIGGLLGHVHPDTTRIYTQIDLKALRSLAQRWPGGVR